LAFGILEISPLDFGCLKPPAKADVKRYSIHRFGFEVCFLDFSNLDFESLGLWDFILQNTDMLNSKKIQSGILMQKGMAVSCTDFFTVSNNRLRFHSFH